MNRPLTLMGSVAVGLLLGACTTPFGPRACTNELRLELTPGDTSVSRGATFPVGARLSTCSGEETLNDDFTFQSADPAIVMVDPGTRRVAAVGVGTARISVTGREHGQLGSILVTVTP